MIDLFSHHASHCESTHCPPPEPDQHRWEPRIRHPLPQVLDHDEMLASHVPPRRSQARSSSKHASSTLIARDNVVRRYVDSAGYEVIVVRRPKATTTQGRKKKLDTANVAKRVATKPAGKQPSRFASGMRNAAMGVGGLAVTSVGGLLAMSGLSARGGGIGGLLVVVAGACVAVLGAAMISAVWKQH